MVCRLYSTALFFGHQNIVPLIFNRPHHMQASFERNIGSAGLYNIIACVKKALEGEVIIPPTIGSKMLVPWCEVNLSYLRVLFDFCRKKLYALAYRDVFHCSHIIHYQYFIKSSTLVLYVSAIRFKASKWQMASDGSFAKSIMHFWNTAFSRLSQTLMFPWDF